MSMNWEVVTRTDRDRIWELERENARLSEALGADDTWRKLRRERELNEILILCCIFLLAVALAAPAAIWAHSQSTSQIGGPAYDVEQTSERTTANTL